MAFIETQFPSDISYGAIGGPEYQTSVDVVFNGAEQANSEWQDARHSYDATQGVKTQGQLDVLLAFFHVMKGRANQFRYKDWVDFTDKINGVGYGIFSAIDATHFQMVKRYTTAGNNQDRIIKKPISGTILITGGTVASVDYTTGIVTMTTGTPTAWTGEFDVPCRFDTDRMKVSIAEYNAYTWGNVPIVEVRV